MIQYLLNMTAIWLLGIIVFDIFLRKENYHGYNRWYLLGIMVTGVLFPLWSWDNNSVIYTIGGSTMAEQTNVVRETIVAATTPKVLSWEDIILYMYLGGAFIMLGRLLFELVNIMRLYRTGDKRNYNDHTIIAINKPLSPFSVLKGIYVYQPENYSSEELAMIMAHEQQHGMLYHTIDLMIMRIFQIVFWFHPLVYMLEKDC